MSPEKILLDINMFSISTSSKKMDFYDNEIYVFQFHYQQTQFLYFLYMVKHSDFIMFPFSCSNQHFFIKFTSSLLAMLLRFIDINTDIMAFQGQTAET